MLLKIQKLHHELSTKKILWSTYLSRPPIKIRCNRVLWWKTRRVKVLTNERTKLKKLWVWAIKTVLKFWPKTRRMLFNICHKEIQCQITQIKRASKAGRLMSCTSSLLRMDTIAHFKTLLKGQHLWFQMQRTQLQNFRNLAQTWIAPSTLWKAQRFLAKPEIDSSRLMLIQDWDCAQIESVRFQTKTQILSSMRTQGKI